MTDSAQRLQVFLASLKRTHAPKRKGKLMLMSNDALEDAAQKFDIVVDALDLLGPASPISVDDREVLTQFFAQSAEDTRAHIKEGRRNRLPESREAA